MSSYIEHEDFTVRPESPPASALERQKQLEAQRELERERLRQAEEREHHRQEMRDRELKKELERERQRDKQRESSADGRHSSGVGLVIGNQLTNPDPVRVAILFTWVVNSIVTPWPRTWELHSRNGMIGIEIIRAEFNGRDGEEEGEDNADVAAAETEAGGDEGTEGSRGAGAQGTGEAQGGGEDTQEGGGAATESGDPRTPQGEEGDRGSGERSESDEYDSPKSASRCNL